MIGPTAADQCSAETAHSVVAAHQGPVRMPDFTGGGLRADTQHGIKMRYGRHDDALRLSLSAAPDTASGG